MEKVLNNIPNNNGIKAEKILEINPKHPIFSVLEKETDDEQLKEYAYILYNEALLIEGFKIENPSEFATKLCNLMLKASK